MADTIKQRPVYRNIHISQIVSYRLPPSGIVSILHRVSGAMIFFLLPFIVWMFDTSVSSEISYERFTSAFTAGIGIFPGWFIKLVALALIWGYLHHFCAGVRHLWMDMTHNTTKAFGRSSAQAVLAIAILLTLLLGAKLFGLY
ncbi:succinate dehydrogenase, cytochrome b556 subunit [Azohydromonas lata]|uniref:Succinate dehydrogenase cytochrome b556 subunit n=1 Tax=Azohydromonas lata TaxID=45677 RepID=A0ABU5IPF4_9BURK|nr:succinate dehydrogenase, cytochrome b556 subunit [Azohydromonas lata]MDZ5460775.1 succinate dehydrogenase, cytochrome b556 subunit [Azohydromonas lata]